MAALLIIGGSDAGISAALRIKELDSTASVTVATADNHPNFSICGLPFFLSGEVSDWRKLSHRSVADIKAQGIELLLKHRALHIDPESRRVSLEAPHGDPRHIHYDRLLIATGAVSARPPIEGTNHPGVFSLRWVDDALLMQEFLEKQQILKVVIIGAGYVGLEMADALRRRRLQVVLLECFPEVLPTLDPRLGRLVRAELERNGVRVMTGCLVEAIERKENFLSVRTRSSPPISTGMVLLAAGARPETRLARSAGIHVGVGDAIRVDRRMCTNVRDIFAAGDCAETWHRLLQHNVYMPLGTTAHKQGRIAGENMIGGERAFQGTLGTQVIRVFDQVAARTGLGDEEAERAGFHPLSVEITAWDHKAYYPGAHEMNIRITGDRATGRLLGAQIVAHTSTQAAKRIDVLASALFHAMCVEELCDLDLSYTPPLSSPWDPIQMAAMKWESQNREESKQIRDGNRRSTSAVEPRKGVS